MQICFRAYRGRRKPFILLVVAYDLKKRADFLPPGGCRLNKVLAK